MAALRVAVVEMLDLGAAPHGVVNAAVSALRANKKTAPLTGMANAVLRRASDFDGWSDLPVQRLPGWLRRRLKSGYGEETVQRIEAAHHAGAAIDLTLKPGATSVPEGETLPGGSLRLPLGAQVSAMPGFETGDWWVQDVAAALPARLLAAQSGETVLDLCAAPGGKTMQLAATGAQVTALDLSEARLQRVRENLARTGLQAQVIRADALDWEPGTPFDAILLDAPCSATGTIRRHPDLPLIRKPADLEALVDLQAGLTKQFRVWQAAILERAVDHPQGRADGVGQPVQTIHGGRPGQPVHGAAQISRRIFVYVTQEAFEQGVQLLLLFREAVQIADQQSLRNERCGHLGEPRWKPW